MSNPVLVEVTRGERIESLHRGAVAIRSADGDAVFTLGDAAALVYPRSAVKALQALPLVESGAADAFGFGTRELALAQASHGGEPAQVEGVSAMLVAIGLGESELECGSHMPTHSASAAALIRQGERANQLHNNCSGKHSGFLAVAQHLGITHRGYVQPHHRVQAIIREAMESVTGVRHDPEACGADGCSIPTYAAPLEALAQGFARFGTGVGLSEARAAAAWRIFSAATEAPYFVAGTGRFCTDVMVLMAGAALVKTGAEGVFCAAIPGRGLGVALKCDDGGTRAAEAAMAAILARLMPAHAEALRLWTNAPVLTRRGAPAGEVRAVLTAFAPLS